MICSQSSWEDRASRMHLSCRMKWEGLGLHLLQVYNESETAEAQSSGLGTSFS